MKKVVTLRERERESSNLKKKTGINKCLINNGDKMTGMRLSFWREKISSKIVGAGLVSAREKDKYIKRADARPAPTGVKFNNIIFRQNTAITLIALIITIIVLLILAGVVLNMVIGENGIIPKAQFSELAANITQQDEMNKMDALNEEINKWPKNSNKNQIATIENKYFTEEKVEDIETCYKVKGKRLDNTQLEKSLKEIIKYIDEVTDSDFTNESTKVQLYQVNNDTYKKDYIVNIATGKTYQYKALKYQGLQWHRPERGYDAETGAVEEPKTPTAKTLQLGNLESNNISLLEGEEKEITVLYDDEDVTSMATKEIANTQIATIENGKIKALKKGTTTMQISYEGQTKTYTINVEEEKEKTLYPDENGDLTTEPNEISISDRWTIPNPYPGEEIYCRAEIKIDTNSDGHPDTWTCTNGFIFNGRGGIGVTASHVKSNEDDYIAIQSGSIALTTIGENNGMGAVLPGENPTSAPLRVIVKKLDATILYPNSNGTSASTTPNVIENDTRWTIANPYPGKDIYCRAEIKVDINEDGTPDTWISTTGFIYSNRGRGYGVTASHVISGNNNYIAVQTGSYSLLASAEDSGVGIDLPDLTSAPVRVIVAEMESTTIYPNSNGTSASTTPNVIEGDTRWTIANPYPEEDVYCVAEIFVDANEDGNPDTWASIEDFILSSRSYGTTASQVKTSNSNYIAIQTGDVLHASSYHCGFGVELANDTTSAPIRVKVFRLK